MITHELGEKYNIHLRFSPEDKRILKAICNFYGLPYSTVILRAIDKLIETDYRLQKIRSSVRQPISK